MRNKYYNVVTSSEVYFLNSKVLTCCLALCINTLFVKLDKPFNKIIYTLLMIIHYVAFCWRSKIQDYA